MPAAVRWLGIHVGVSDRPRLCGRPHREDRRRLDRGDEADHRTQALRRLPGRTTPELNRNARTMANPSTNPMRADVLQGKRILITGGGTGLGKELARAFS